MIIYIGIGNLILGNGVKGGFDSVGENCLQLYANPCPPFMPYWMSRAVPFQQGV